MGGDICRNKFENSLGEIRIVSKSKDFSLNTNPSLAHIRQSRPDSGLTFQVKVFETFNMFQVLQVGVSLLRGGSTLERVSMRMVSLMVTKSKGFSSTTNPYRSSSADDPNSPSAQKYEASLGRARMQGS